DFSEELEVNGVVSTRKAKRDDVYAQVFDTAFFKFPILATKLSLDYRLLKEKFKSDQFDISPRLHQSFAVSASTQLYHTIWALLGVHYGKSKMHDDIVVDGYQLDLGLNFLLRDGLNFVAMFAEEHRNEE